jgi:hypothetical protein
MTTEQDRSPRFVALRVCREHGGIYDTLDDPDLEHRQTCHGDRGDTWENFDFNEWIHLCHCCVSGTARSGSRWAPFWCNECRPRVFEVRKRLHLPIPLGRHSMMNGFGLSVKDALSDAAVEGFVGGLNAMQAAIEHSMEWRRDRIALALGEHEGDPALVELFSRAEAAWTRLEAFHAMVECWKRDGN